MLSRVVQSIKPLSVKSYYRAVSFQQSRSFFAKALSSGFNTALEDAKLDLLRKQFDRGGGLTDEHKVLSYLKEMNTISPKEAAKVIESGWKNQKIPMNEPVLREYFKAVGALNKFDSVNIQGLLALMPQDGHVAALKGNDSAAITQALASISANSSGGFTAGSSPSNPLYITRENPSFRAQMWKLLRQLLGMFMVLSFIGAMLDDMKGGAMGGRMGMGSAVHQAEHSDKTFDDVVGVDEAKGELEEIVEYLRNPRKFTRLGGKLPKGVLLTGPPGTGKTLLARAIAGEAGVPFFYSSGSEFEEMYVGVGASRVRKLFEAAKSKSPCIIFIDEIDAIGSSRQEKDQSHMKMTLNQLLVEMDGFEQNKGVIVIAATNFADILDKALTRPGRFDKHVNVPMPDIGGRKAILDLYSQRVPIGNDVDTEQIARGTPGFSGAELFNLVNQAALKAAVDGLKNVGMAAFEHAKDKIMMGAERQSAIISPENMKLTAFHEAGHALVAIKTDGSDPVHKATIMPRGRALGMVMQLPDGDQTSQSFKEMLARMDICMGGRVAEELIYGAENVTSGAVGDFQQATRLARAMITKYGYSDKVGPIFLDDRDKLSGETSKQVDEEVNRLLSESYDRAKSLLLKHRKDLDIIANGLVEYETLSGGEIVDLLNGKKPNMKGVRSQRPSRATQEIPLRKSKSKGNGSSGGGAGGRRTVNAKVEDSSSNSNTGGSFFNPWPSSKRVLNTSPPPPITNNNTAANPNKATVEPVKPAASNVNKVVKKDTPAAPAANTTTTKRGPPKE